MEGIYSSIIKIYLLFISFTPILDPIIQQLAINFYQTSSLHAQYK